MARRLLLILALLIIGDIYFFQAVRTLSSNPLLHWSYWLLDMLLLAGIISTVLLLRAGRNTRRFIPFLMSGLILLFIPKLFSSPVLLAEDITRLFRGFPPRNIYISETTLVLAGLILLVSLFGLTRGMHFYQVKKETLFFPDLPQAFDGFTITQLSDIHAGSFTNEEQVRKGIGLANAQHSDLLLFTGDLVNNMASEMQRWIPFFSRLQAPYGKYSILGNHDYGDYMRWPDQQTKAANLKKLKETHGEIGFRLLLDESVTIDKLGQHISLIGVENWGKGSHQYGDLQKATAKVPDNAFKILLSHDPSHWDEVTLKHRQPVQLTLAGHTHGMQFGIELFGLKWSPIQYFYKQWAGLYESAGKYLYVNRGFGFHGLRGRIGIWPEITVLTLKRSTSHPPPPAA